MPREQNPRLFLQTQRFIQQKRRLNISIAMNLPVAKEARVLQAGNQPQYARLLAKFQMVLKTHQVITVSAQIFFAQLHHGPGRPAGARVAQTHRLHRTESQSVAASTGQHFDGQAALEIVEFLPLFGLGRLCCQQRIQKAIELRAVHGAVDVVSRPFVPARGKINPLHVDGIGFDNGRDRVVERQMACAGNAFNLRAQRVRGQRAGGQNRQRIVAQIQPRHFFAHHANPGLGCNGLGDPPRKLDAIHGQRVACRYSRCIGNTQQRRPRPSHLLFQQPRRRVRRFTLQRIGADQFSELGRLVGRRQPRLAIHHRPHLVEFHSAAQPRSGQRRFRPRQSSADNANLHSAISDFRSSTLGAPSLRRFCFCRKGGIAQRPAAP